MAIGARALIRDLQEAVDANGGDDLDVDVYPVYEEYAGSEIWNTHVDGDTFRIMHN